MCVGTLHIHMDVLHCVYTCVMCMGTLCVHTCECGCVLCTVCAHMCVGTLCMCVWVYCVFIHVGVCMCVHTLVHVLPSITLLLDDCSYFKQSYTSFKNILFSITPLF
jgi:hypothetical protein